MILYIILFLSSFTHIQTKLKKREMTSREEEIGIIVLKWRATRDVQILSKKHAPTFVPVAPKK